MIGAAQVSIARVVTDAQPSTCVGFLYKPLDGVRSATNPGLIEHELKWTDLLVSSEYSLHWVRTRASLGARERAHARIHTVRTRAARDRAYDRQNTIKTEVMKSSVGDPFSSVRLGPQVKHWEYLLFLLLAVVVMFVGKLLYVPPPPL